MSFRDNGDALLARAEALEAENARLTEELAGARAELARAQRAVAEVEAARQALEAEVERRASRPTPRAATPRASGGRDPGLAVAAVKVAAIGVVAAVLVLGGRYAARGPAPAAPAVSPASGAEPSAEHVLRAVTRLRSCLDNGDVYLRAFLAAPHEARRKDLLGHVAGCRSSLESVSEAGVVTEAMEYQARLEDLRRDVERLATYFESGEHLYDDGALARTLEGGLVEPVARWRAASDALRAAAVVPYRDALDLGLARAASDAGKTAFLQFSATAAAFLDAVLAPPSSTAVEPDLERLAAALEAMRGAHRDAGPRGQGAWGTLIATAQRLIDGFAAEGTLELSARTAPILVELVGQYNAESLGRPYPF